MQFYLYTLYSFTWQRVAYAAQLPACGACLCTGYGNYLGHGASICLSLGRRANNLRLNGKPQSVTHTEAQLPVPEQAARQPGKILLPKEFLRLQFAV